MRIEANTLQEAFRKAAEELNCSVTELDIKVIQNPSVGFLGFFKKTAIIEAEKEGNKPKHMPKKSFEKRDKNLNKEHKNRAEKEQGKEGSQTQKQENSGEKQNSSLDKKRRDKNKKRRDKEKKDSSFRSSQDSKHANLNIVADPFKSSDVDENFEIKDQILPTNKPRLKTQESENILDNSIIDTFNKGFEEQELKPEIKKEQKPRADIDRVLPEIKDGMVRLFEASCFSLSKIEVSKFDDETLLVELDGEDAALLIGKEGYRYKAISYLVYNWINSKYNLLVRLEIAEFLKNQENGLGQYIDTIIQKVESSGRAKTKPLDGILVKIALDKLRAKFPQKYVAVKSDRGKQFVVVNDFAKKHE